MRVVCKKYPELSLYPFKDHEKNRVDFHNGEAELDTPTLIGGVKKFAAAHPELALEFPPDDPKEDQKGDGDKSGDDKAPQGEDLV